MPGRSPPLAAVARRGEPHGDGRPCRVPRRGWVLLVDDDEALRRLFGIALRREGYEVLEAHDVPAARAQVSALLRVPGADLAAAVTDLTMPGGDGFSLLAHLRARLPSVPAVLLTGCIDPRTVARARGLGADAVLFKPVTMDDLCHTLDRLVASPAVE